MFFDGFFNFFSFDGGMMIIDVFVEVFCFFYVLFLIKFIIDEIYIIVCMIRSICENFVSMVSNGVREVVCIRVVFV